MEKDAFLLKENLRTRYTVVARWTSPADGVVGLVGLTVQACCLSGYSQYPLSQPPAQLSPNQRATPKGLLLWLSFGNGNGPKDKKLLSERYSCMHREKSSLVFITVMFRSRAMAMLLLSLGNA